MSKNVKMLVSFGIGVLLTKKALLLAPAALAGGVGQLLFVGFAVYGLFLAAFLIETGHKPH